jgi:hypothetical protein
MIRVHVSITTMELNVVDQMMRIDVNIEMDWCIKRRNAIFMYPCMKIHLY